MREDSLKKSALQWLKKYRSAQAHHTLVTTSQIELQAARVAKLMIGLRAPGMMLLDDPVGTGKTPVSLCVARMLFDQGEIDHALVVAPSDRVAKIWHERAKMLELVPHSERKTPGAKRWRRNQLVVATQRTVPGGIYQDQKPGRTLVIIDEAHRGLGSEDTDAFQSIEPLAQGTRVLLVTATPLQISPDGFLNMLTIGLDGSGKEKLRAPVQAYAHAVKRLLHQWSKDADAKSGEEEVRSLRASFEKAILPYRLPPYPHYDEDNIPKLHGDPIKLTDASEWVRAYHVAQIVPELLGDGKGDMFQRRLVSCGEAFWKGHAGRRLDPEEQVSHAPERLSLIQQLKIRLGAGSSHPKVKATCDWVVRRATNRVKPRHILVFCVFKESQEVLNSELVRLLGEDSVACPDDQVRSDWKDRFRQEPSKSVKPLVLIVRDNLSESIDLDGGHPCVVHHDLPWNPARIQQRYGRVVRISTGFQRVDPADVFMPVLDTEVDRRMFDTLVHRCELIQRLIPNNHGLRAHTDHLPTHASKS